MADQHLRALQRRAQETGAIADEARYLIESARAGVLPESGLELAAALGHPAARVARGESEDRLGDLDSPGAIPVGEEVIGPDGRSAFYIPSQEPSGVESWAKALVFFGPAVAVRVSVAAARLVLPLWEHGEEASSGPPLGAAPQARQAIEAAERWALDPSPEATHAATEARQAMEDVLTRTFYPWVLSAGYAAEQAAVVEPVPGRLPPAERAVRCAGEGRTYFLIRSAGLRPAPDTWEAYFTQAARELRAAIRADLLPWALGRGDPVRERVAAQ